MAQNFFRSYRFEVEGLNSGFPNEHTAAKIVDLREFGLLLMFNQQSERFIGQDAYFLHAWYNTLAVVEIFL